MSKRKYIIDGLIMGVAGLLMVGGLYVLFLLYAPAVRLPAFLPASQVDLNVHDDLTDKRDRIQIEKLNVEVPFYTGKDTRTLDKGAWHRFPERGNPQKGGNFILSAHRFNLGLTPGGTKAKSPFYNLHKLAVGDTIRVMYQGTVYRYEVSRKYSVKPNAVSIEDPSDEAKLTLYSCTLKGSADGREVVEAKPVAP